MKNEEIRSKIEDKNFLTEAVRFFWDKREEQALKQKNQGGKDQGSRSQVTGGKQFEKVAQQFADLLIKIGIPENDIYTNKGKTILPGYFRAVKGWDLVIISSDKEEKELIAAIEFKSQVGSFGNNFNNRTEEALGTAVDFKTAWNEHAFLKSRPPWIGYFLLLEDSIYSTRKGRKPGSPHFSPFPEFNTKLSYADKYYQYCIRIIRKNHYNSACLILSDKNRRNDSPNYSEFEGITVNSFALSLLNHLNNYYKVFS